MEKGICKSLYGMFTRIMENLFPWFRQLNYYLYLFMWRKENQGITVIRYSLCLRRHQLCRNPKSLESRSCWQVGGGGGNLFNGKLMRPWAPRSKQMRMRKRAKDSKRLYSAYSDSQWGQHLTRACGHPQRKWRRTGKVNMQEPKGRGMEVSSAGLSSRP